MIKGLLKNIKEGQKIFGEDIASIINFLLLSIVYFVGVGITFIFARVFGRHFLQLKPNRKYETYWSESNLTKKPFEEYYRQF